jgi:hypothetical protein
MDRANHMLVLDTTCLIQQARTGHTDRRRQGPGTGAMFQTGGRRRARKRGRYAVTSEVY